MFAHFKLSIQFVGCCLSIGGLSIITLLASAAIAVAQINIAPIIYFETPVESITQDGIFTVKIFASTSNPINALSVNVSYPQELLELRSINTAGSFVNFWRGVAPVADNGIVYFEGGTTVPFSGSGGKIGELVFEAKKQGIAHLASLKADFYYADGTGTRVSAENAQANILISSEGTATSSPLLFQSAPPPIVDARIIENPIGGYSLAAFVVTDKGAGIQSSQIRFLKYFFWSHWENVSNPTPIPSTALVFQVRVVDGNGNIVGKTVYVWKTLIIACLFAVVIITIGVVGLRTYRLWRRRRVVL